MSEEAGWVGHIITGFGIVLAILGVNKHLFSSQSARIDKVEKEIDKVEKEVDTKQDKAVSIDWREIWQTSIAGIKSDITRISDAQTGMKTDIALIQSHFSVLKEAKLPTAEDIANSVVIKIKEKDSGNNE